MKSSEIDVGRFGSISTWEIEIEIEIDREIDRRNRGLNDPIVCVCLTRKLFAFRHPRVRSACACIKLTGTIVASPRSTVI